MWAHLIGLLYSKSRTSRRRFAASTHSGRGGYNPDTQTQAAGTIHAALPWPRLVHCSMEGPKSRWAAPYAPPNCLSLPSHLHLRRRAAAAAERHSAKPGHLVGPWQPIRFVPRRRPGRRCDPPALLTANTRLRPAASHPPNPRPPRPPDAPPAAPPAPPRARFSPRPRPPPRLFSPPKAWGPAPAPRKLLHG